MKNYKNEIVCIYHKQPISKIDTVSKRFICPKCQQESPQNIKNRLEVLRAKLNASYMEELQKLKNTALLVQKVEETFISHNMVDAKRKIKKQLPAVQLLIDNLVNKQIEEANKQLKIFIEKLLRPWNSLQNKKFDFAFVEFQKNYGSLAEQIEEKKKELKQKIAVKIKNQLAVFYCKLFNL